MVDEKGTILHSLSFPAQERYLYDWVQKQAETRKVSMNEVIRECIKEVSK